jgi:AraC-like DNA-binding protein
LLLPHLRLLKRYPGIPPEMLAPLEALDLDERVPVADILALQRGALEITGDEDLGLKAAHEIAQGDYGALEYAARSAADWEEAITVIGRYMRLVNDALVMTLHVVDEQAEIHFDDRVELPRASVDFQAAAIYRSVQRIALEGTKHEFQIWFTHRRPLDLTEYERTFGESVLRFSAPFNGFVFPRRFLRAKMSAADPALHGLIRKHAELLLSELPKGAAESLTEKVRDRVAAQLEKGDPGIANIARELSMSPRTLGRKLEREGTTFKNIVDDLRHRLALRYVANYDLSLTEVAFLLGFSQSAAFHRAFKRWTSQTPLEYRRLSRGRAG